MPTPGSASFRFEGFRDLPDIGLRLARLDGTSWCRVSTYTVTSIR